MFNSKNKNDSSVNPAKRLDSIRNHISPESQKPGWQTTIDELEYRKSLARTPNPNDPGYVRQKTAGKLWVRERIENFVDKDSFREHGSIAGKVEYDKDDPTKIIGFTPGNFVGGRATIQGRPIVVGADDFSVRGGHADGAVIGKSLYTEQLARALKIPMIRLIDGSSGGGSVTLILDHGATYVPPLPGMDTMVSSLSEIPVCAAVLGPAVGLGAARATMTHFSVLAESVGQVFAAGPPVVRYATFESVTKDELGGARVQTSNGMIDCLARSEEDAFHMIRTFLSYLPSNSSAIPPRISNDDPITRADQELLDIIPVRRQRTYKIREVITRIVDRDSWFEIGTGWGRTSVVGFARLNGYSIGVLAQDCEINGGGLMADGCMKTRRHIDLCETFGVPLLNLVDQPGFAVGTEAEKTATIRHGSNLIAALYQCTLPILTIIIRRVFGVAGAAFVDNRVPNLRFAWPSAEWGSLPLEGGIEAAYKRQLDAAPDRKKLLDELLAKFDNVRSPLRTAEQFDIQEIIDPRETRKLGCEWIEIVNGSVLPERLERRKIAMAVKGGSVLYRP